MYMLPASVLQSTTCLMLTMVIGLLMTAHNAHVVTHYTENRGQLQLMWVGVAAGLVLLDASLGGLVILLGLTAQQVNSSDTRVVSQHLGLVALTSLVCKCGVSEGAWVTAAIAAVIFVDMASLLQSLVIVDSHRQAYVLGQGALTAMLWVSVVNGILVLVLVWVMCKLGAGVGIYFLPVAYGGAASTALRYIGIASFMQAMGTSRLSQKQGVGSYTLCTSLVGASLLSMGVWLAAGLLWTGHTHVLATSTGLTMVVVVVGIQVHTTWVTGLLICSSVTWVLLVDFVTAAPQSTGTGVNSHRATSSAMMNRTNSTVNTTTSLMGVITNMGLRTL